jgi:hypothetical protein
MKKILALTVLSSVLAGCGSGSGSDSKVSPPPLLSDISRVWDARETKGQSVDEEYVVIKANSTAISYDYQGDSEDNGENCYIIENSAFTDLGNGIFQNDDGTGFVTTNRLATSNNSLNGTLLTINGIEATKFFADNNITDESLTFSWTASSLLESDFSPICEELE